MTLRVTIYCFIQFLQVIAFSQKELQPVILKGSITVDTGMVELFPIGDPSYYPDSTLPLSKAFIHHGKFVFRGKGAYPCPFLLLLTSSNSYISGKFYLDTGEEHINFDTDSFRAVPEMHNPLMNEYSQVFLPKFDSVESTYAYGSSRRYHRGEFLMAYAKDHPQSQIVLWELVEQTKGWYMESLDTAYGFLDPAVKNNFTGLRLKEQFQLAKRTMIGQPLPVLHVTDLKGNAQDLNFSHPSNTYTLLDFWFSHCGPCLGEFNEYRKIYAALRPRLQIVGISTDNENQISSWKKVIKDSSLLWPQFRDEGGLQSKTVSVTIFPSNFLLDQHGKIVGKNMSPEEVEAFVAKQSADKSAQ